MQVTAAVTRTARSLVTATSTLSPATQRLLDATGARVPIIKGPMYPGSNPELVAAVSEAGGFGVVQPIALTHLYGHDFREGLQLIKSLTDRPFGVNITIVPHKKYQKLSEEWMDIAIDEGVKFFLTSLGKPDAIVRLAERHSLTVFHDVHDPKVARKAADAGVHGLNCLNNDMGGQTGNRSAEQFIKELEKGGFEKLPLVAAGGVGDAAGLKRMLDLGYAGAQLGTRFLATPECQVTDSYKQAICKASSSDIVWTNKLAGTNSSVIRTPYVEEGGLRTSALMAWLLKNSYTKNLVRVYMLQNAMKEYKKAATDESVEVWQAGKGVDYITSIQSCKAIIDSFATVASR